MRARLSLHLCAPHLRPGVGWRSCSLVRLAVWNSWALDEAGVLGRVACGVEGERIGGAREALPPQILSPSRSAHPPCCSYMEWCFWVLGSALQ